MADKETREIFNKLLQFISEDDNLAEKNELKELVKFLNSVFERDQYTTKYFESDVLYLKPVIDKVVLYIIENPKIGNEEKAQFTGFFNNYMILSTYDMKRNDTEWYEIENVFHSEVLKGREDDNLLNTIREHKRKANYFLTLILCVFFSGLALFIFADPIVIWFYEPLRSVKTEPPVTPKVNSSDSVLLNQMNEELKIIESLLKKQSKKVINIYPWVPTESNSNGGVNIYNSPNFQGPSSINNPDPTISYSSGPFSDNRKAFQRLKIANNYIDYTLRIEELKKELSRQRGDSTQGNLDDLIMKIERLAKDILETP
jgi:hypothetical protein